MDSFAIGFLVLAAVVFIGAMVGFWTLSKKCPPGVVLVLAIAIYVLSRVIGNSSFGTTSRIGNGFAGVLGLIGFAGFLLGLIDLRRLMGSKSRNTAVQNSLLRQSMGSKAPSPRAKNEGRSDAE